MSFTRADVKVFIAGTAVGTCLALALARLALSPRRQWSWKEWRSWQSLAAHWSPPPTPTRQAWAVPNGDSVSRLELVGSGSVSGHKGSFLSSPPLQTVSAALAAQHDDIVSEQFTRNVQFFGEAGQMRVHNAFIVVIGLGGVGSHAAAMLLRSGVGSLRIVDFDQVTLSSLNRHAVATRADVGTPKAFCLHAHFMRIFPECDVDARVTMFEPATEDEILAGRPDYVLDCIDNIDTKVHLLAACKRRGLRVLSATGAGGRADPTRIRIADLAESSTDPLSRAVRHRLRKDHGIETGIPVIFSTERPSAKLLPFEAPNGEENANPLDYQVVPGFRVRTIPVLGSLPAMFGLAMAAHVLTELAGLDVHPEPVIRLGLEHYSTLHRRLLEREELRFGTAEEVEVDVEEVMYVVKELWRGRSARDQGPREAGRGMWRSMNTMTLTRWDESQPPSISNLILLTFDEAEQHEATPLEELKQREPDFFDMVISTLSRAWADFHDAAC